MWKRAQPFGVQVPFANLPVFLPFVAAGLVLATACQGTQMDEPATLRPGPLGWNQETSGVLGITP